jgi:protein SCO1/2
MKSFAALLAFTVFAGGASPALQEHAAKGIVLKVDFKQRAIVVSCDPIPGYMEAMEMPFAVADAKVLAGLTSGEMIRFTIVDHGKTLYAEKILPGAARNFESEPMEAGRLTALHRALDPSLATSIVKEGQPIPDFTLTDQAQKQVRLSALQGKVVALTFGYSRCPNPTYCYRLSNNLAIVERRFHARTSRDLALITIAIDPEHDQGATLARYAASWNADPQVWHFLTGPLPQIRQVAGMFGMDFGSNEGLLTHTLHTVVIDRQGRLVANINGNEFSAKQLGDLVQTVMDRP